MRSIRRNTVLRSICLAVATWTCGAAATATAAPAVPGTVSLEGALFSDAGGPVVDGKYNMVISLYGAKDADKAVWLEGPIAVAAKGGHFHYVVGTTKPVNAALLADLDSLWLGIKIEDEPEMPRQPFHVVPFAIYAARAEALACSGCIGADQLASGSISDKHLAFTYAGSKSKGGAADLALVAETAKTADKALALQCTGCVHVDHITWDGDVDLGGNALKAKLVSSDGIKAGDVQAETVQATTITADGFSGDGSGLTGIVIPKGDCPPGQAVVGIEENGKLKCDLALDPAGLPANGLNEISNDLLFNQFQDKVGMPVPGMPISDNKKPFTISAIDFPDIGLAEDFKVHVKLSNSDLSKVTVKLYPPEDKVQGYTLCGPCGEVDAKSLDATWPVPDQVKEGDLGAWVGKNPQGKWDLEVQDTDFCVVQKDPANCHPGAGTDGQIEDWSIEIQTLSNKKVKVAGDLYVDGSVYVGKNVKVDGDIDVGNVDVSKSVAVGENVTVEGDLTVKGKINGGKQGDVFTNWGSKQCPAGHEKLYDGVAYTAHHSHSGSGGDVECIVRADKGVSTGTESLDLLYPITIDHNHGTTIPANHLIYCARCYTAEKGPCYEQLGSDTCPSGFEASYKGWSFSTHYTHSANTERICIDKDKFDKSTSWSGGSRMYASRLQNSPSGNGGDYPEGYSLKCAMCCRK